MYAMRKTLTIALCLLLALYVALPSGWAEGDNSQAMFDVPPAEASELMEPEEYEGHVYRLFETTDESYAAMEAFCEALNGHLACIGSAGEDDFLRLKQEEQGIIRTIFGLWCDESGEWRWVNGEPLDYLSWADNEPNGFAVGERYSVYDLGIYPNGRWNDSWISDVSVFWCEWESAEDVPQASNDFSAGPPPVPKPAPLPDPVPEPDEEPEPVPGLEEETETAAEPVLCPGCGYVFSDGVLPNFCPECGMTLRATCPGCGHVFSRNEVVNYCPDCGAPFDWVASTETPTPEPTPESMPEPACANCGYVFEDGLMPAYCPECGAKQ